VIAVEELELRILAELEEAGQGDVATVMNVVFLPERKADQLEPYLEALRNLVDRNDVRLSTALGLDRRLKALSIEESLNEINGQKSVLTYDPVQKYWIDSSISGPPYGPYYPYVVLTDVGRQKSEDVLVKRGYQWWAPVA
jgi:hypothetical protein